MSAWRTLIPTLRPCNAARQFLIRQGSFGVPQCCKAPSRFAAGVLGDVARLPSGLARRCGGLRWSSLQQEELCHGHPAQRSAGNPASLAGDDMMMRGLNVHTRRDYSCHFRHFAAFLVRSSGRPLPRRSALATPPAGRVCGAPTTNSAVAAVRILFMVTLDRPDLWRRLVLSRVDRGGG